MPSGNVIEHLKVKLDDQSPLLKAKYRSKNQQSITTISESSVSQLTGHTEDDIVRTPMTQPDLYEKPVKKQKLGNLFKLCATDKVN